MMMVDRAAVLARLAALAATGDPAQLWVTRLCEASRLLVNGRGGSVSLHGRDRSRVTLAATDDVAAQLENLQDVLADGPCLWAYRDNQAMSADLEHGAGRLWPDFIRSAREVAGDVILYCFPVS
jgi:hypothetical protein